MITKLLLEVKMGISSDLMTFPVGVVGLKLKLSFAKTNSVVISL